MIMQLVCPLLISGAINSNLAVLYKMGVNIDRFRPDVIERNTAHGALEYHDLKGVFEIAEVDLDYPPELSPIIAAQLLHESKHLSAKRVRDIKNDSGRFVSIGGYTQMSPSLRRKYKKMGKSVFKVEDAPFIMAHYMLELAGDIWSQLTLEDKAMITVKQLWTNALKRYNGAGYDSYRTIHRTMSNLGSNGSKENRDYVVSIVAGFHVLTPSEFRGLNNSGTIRDWGTLTDTKLYTLRRIQRVEGVIQALKAADFCIEETALFLQTKVINSRIFK